MPATLEPPATSLPAGVTSSAAAGITGNPSIDDAAKAVAKPATPVAAVADAKPADAVKPAADAATPAPAAAARGSLLADDAAAPNAPAAPAPKVEDSAPAPVYALKAPEKSALTADDLKTIEAFAKEKKISPEAAQAIVERESALIDTVKTAHTAKAQADLSALTTSWKEQVRKDPLIGGPKWNDTVKLVDRALVDEPDMFDLLKSSGFAHHPVVVAYLARQGAKTREGAAPIGGSASPVQEKPLAQVMFPSSYKTKTKS